MPNATGLWNEFNQGNIRPRAVRKFTDRLDFRQAYYDMVSRAFDENFQNYYAINYHGIGGVGKSSLLRQFEQELFGDGDQGEMRGLDAAAEACARARGKLAALRKKQKPVVLRADFDDSSLNTPQDVIFRFRTQIASQCSSAVFPLFDMALHRLSQKYGKPLPPEEHKELLIDNPVLSFALDTVGDLTGIGLLIGAAKTAVQVSQGLSRQLAGRRNSIQKANLEMSRMSAPELERHLPYYFSMDVNAMDLPLVCIYLDTYEKMVSSAEGAGRSTGFTEEWLRGEYGLLKNLGNAVFAIAGRERLDWEEMVECRYIEALSERDSVEFLASCGIDDDRLQKELYRLTGGEPIFLDLCVDEYEYLKDMGKKPEPEDFGRNQERLVERQIRYVPIHLQDAVYILSAIGRWTDKLYDDLAERLPQLPRSGGTEYETLLHLTYIQKEGEVWSMQRSVADILSRALPPGLRSCVTEALLEMIRMENASKSSESSVCVREEGLTALHVLWDMDGDIRPTPALARLLEVRAEQEREQRNFAQSAQWQIRSLEMWKRLGEEYPGPLLDSYCGLADIFLDMGREEQARDICQEGMEVYCRLEDTAPAAESFRLLKTCAQIYERSELTLEEAHSVWERLLQLRCRLAPEEQRDILEVKYELAMFQEDQELQYDLLVGILKGFERLDRKSGERHPDTLLVLDSMQDACLWRQNELTTEILERELTADGGDGRAVGETAACEKELARLEAEREKWKALRLEHCQTIWDWDFEAICRGESLDRLYILERWCRQTTAMDGDSLLSVYRQVHGAFKRMLGPIHPSTLRAALNAIRVFVETTNKNSMLDQAASGDRDSDAYKIITGWPEGISFTFLLPDLFEDPEKLIRECKKFIALCYDALGREHPDTYAAREPLADIYESCGRFDEAIDCRRAMAAGYAQLYGDSSEEAGAQERRLIDLLLRAGRMEEAASRQEHLAWTLRKLSDKSRAIRELKRLSGILYAMLRQEMTIMEEKQVSGFLSEKGQEYLERLCQTVESLGELQNAQSGVKTSFYALENLFDILYQLLKQEMTLTQDTSPENSWKCLNRLEKVFRQLADFYGRGSREALERQKKVISLLLESGCPEKAVPWLERFIQDLSISPDREKAAFALGQLFDLLRDTVKQEMKQESDERARLYLPKLCQVMSRLDDVYLDKSWQDLCQGRSLSNWKQSYWKQKGELAVMLLNLGCPEEAVVQKEQLVKALSVLSDRKEVSCLLQSLFDILYEQLKRESAGEQEEKEAAAQLNQEKLTRFRQIFIQVSDLYNELYGGDCLEAFLNEKKLFNILWRFRRTEEAVWRLEHLAQRLTTKKWAGKWAPNELDNLFDVLYQLYEQEIESGADQPSKEAEEYLDKLLLVGRQLSDLGRCREEMAELENKRTL